MDKDKALRIALEALVDFGWHIENCPQFPTWAEPKKHPPCTCGYDTAITALRQALEQPEREPVAWIHRIIESGQPVATHVNQVPPEKYDSWWESLPLYTAPPKRKWVGLTDEEIAEGAKQSWVDKQAFESAVWWAEKKLREKNGF